MRLKDFLLFISSASEQNLKPGESQDFEVDDVGQIIGVVRLRFNGIDPGKREIQSVILNTNMAESDE